MATNHERYRDVEQAYWKSEGVEPTEQFFTLPGGNRVRIQESGEGEPLVFVHGGSSSGANFAPLLARLPGVRCIALDRPGCGLSDPVPNAGDMQNLVKFKAFTDRMLVDVLDAMELSSATVAATSAGGMYALRGAATHPDRFERFIGIAWLMGAPMMTVPMSMRFGVLPGVGALVAKIPPTRFAIKTILKQLGMGRAIEAGKITDEMVSWFQSLLRDTDTLNAERRTGHHFITPMGPNTDVYLSDEVLGRIVMPSLFLWGDEDPMGGTAVAETFTSRLPDATLEMIPQASHAPWIDEPDLMARRIADFMGAKTG